MGRCGESADRAGGGATVPQELGGGSWTGSAWWLERQVNWEGLGTLAPSQQPSAPDSQMGLATASPKMSLKVSLKTGGLLSHALACPQSPSG